MRREQSRTRVLLKCKYSKGLRSSIEPGCDFRDGRMKFQRSTWIPFSCISAIVMLFGFAETIPALEAGEIRPTSGQILEDIFTFGQPTTLGPPRKESDKAEAVLALCYSPDGRLLATAGAARNIKPWDVSTGKRLNVLTGHADAITFLAFSPDGKLLASACYDRTIRLWDVVAGKELTQFMQLPCQEKVFAASPQTVEDPYSYLLCPDRCVLIMVGQRRCVYGPARIMHAKKVKDNSFLKIRFFRRIRG